jgi:N-hydroxyarylamine O-acetyltransferase
MFDLDAYLARVHYQGARAPTLTVLRDLTAAHAQTIPFENLDVLLGRRIDLEIDAIFDKLVSRRRGGYCFEQNGLLLHVLTALGFQARPLSARVRIDRPRDQMPPRTHVFIGVEIDGQSWLTDVGVGALSLTAPLRISPDVAQQTPHETRRLVREDAREGPRWFHQVLLGEVWADVCEFTGEEMPGIDREVASWFTSAHPASHFRNRLVVARAAPDGRRITLLNRELKLRDRDGHAETCPIESAPALLATLAEHFGLHFPADTRFGAGATAVAWPT